MVNHIHPETPRLVIDALKEINDEKRGCYRLIGGVLVGRTVGEILPSLEKNVENVSSFESSFEFCLSCLSAA